MNFTNNVSFVPTLPWFKSWFDSAFYHKLYSNRNEKEAAGFIDELIIKLDPQPGSQILDLGCGSGRHSRYLASKGFYVTGIDLAFSSIREAKKYETEFLRFVQYDMRFPFGRNRFDYVFSFFTSFGYFKTQTENETVIRNISNSLKPGGKLILDYLNAEYAEQHLVASEEKEIDGIFYHITRWMNDKYFFKRIVIEDISLASGKPLEFTEQVERFSLNDFRNMLSVNDLLIDEVYGDYKLNEYNKETSPRMIVFAEKTGLKIKS